MPDWLCMILHLLYLNKDLKDTNYRRHRPEVEAKQTPTKNTLSPHNQIREREDILGSHEPRFSWPSKHLQLPVLAHFNQSIRSINGT